MTKSELKKLATLRIKEAEILFNNKCFNGAIYIGGYSIELALKARICSLLCVTDFPPIKNSKDFQTHNIIQLLTLAGLTSKLEDRISKDTNFATSWSTILLWNSSLRYSLNFNENNPKKQDALDFLHAITDYNYGIYTWIKKYW